MEVFTIGFTQTRAAEFFGKLAGAGIRRLIDVRLNNTSQLAAYTKREDLIFFLQALGKMEYVHEPLLAPNREILNAYKKDKGSWQDYEEQFLQLMADRRVEEAIDRQLFSVPSVLLCSEKTADHCHRRLVCEYLNRKWKDLEAIHL